MLKQKVVIIMGSKNDLDFANYIGIALKEFDVKYEYEVASAHKTPKHLLEILKKNEESAADIVYITVAGLSDALSGFVAGSTEYPVIACPPDAEKYGWSKVFSSVMTPKGVAVSFVLKPENAALAAVKILALSNPSLRKKFDEYRQKTQEEVIKAGEEVKGGSVSR
jgi:5-(carboxyamino)imidazole ribonucleotide mutase